MTDFEKRVNFCSDGLDLTIMDYSRILSKIAENNHISMDSYSLGGCVEELENISANILKKERAIFMPTGTLANQIAVRTLIGSKSRVLTQKMSHLYCDSGDCVQKLNALNLIPLGDNEATFSLEEVKEQVEMAEAGKVETGVGVISIETPVRRKNGAMFDVEEMKKISGYAREKDIKLHLDGARIFIASAYTGIQPSEYARYFDTVYISLYKYFNAPSGAMLAGPSNIIEKLFHVRRMYGAGLNQAWLFAAFALYFFEGFPKRFRTAVQNSEVFKTTITKSHFFEVENIPNGSNVFKLHVNNDLDVKNMKQNLKKHNIILPDPDTLFHGYLLKVNESMNYMPPDKLVDYFLNAVDNRHYRK